MSLFYSTDKIRVLDKIQYPEIKIEEKKFSFISGKSGCGKSTYLKMLNFTVIPNDGEIFYHGKNIKTYPVLSYRREVLLVPQEVFLLNSSIKDNFQFYYDAREQTHLTDEDMEKFLKICCIDFPIYADCKKLSGGERQRVFLAIFLSFAEKVILLDEPTAALDEKTSLALLTNIKNYCKQENITPICVCHNENLIHQFADSIIRLGDDL